jgi:electron transfer flavoprotein beta subunit
MDILVCIKQVPDPNYFSQIILDPITRAIQREGIPVIMNPVDRNAVETALQIQEKFSGKVTVISMGPPQAREALEEALAMGADEAILLCDRPFAGSDAFATAHTLAAAIKEYCTFNLILCGNETIDSGTKIVGPQLAEFLDIPYASNARTMRFSEEGVCVVERPLENGYMKVEIKLPALVTMNKAINEPRIPNVMGIMQVASKKFHMYGCNDVGLPSDNTGLTFSPTRVADIYEFRQERRLKILQGKPEQVAKDAVAGLVELHAI